MKILYYNWAAFDTPDQLGGGVSVYQRDLIAYLVENSEHEVSFLSSGWKCNPLRRGAYIVSTRNVFGDGCKSYEIINSPIMAPSPALVGLFKQYNLDYGSVDIFKRFLLRYGPFDIVHFNNLEGISVNVLALRAQFKKTKFIVTIHNYQTICPLTQYFQLADNRICNDFREGKRCLECVSKIPNVDEYARHCKNFFYGKLEGRRCGKLVKPLFKVIGKLCANYRRFIGDRPVASSDPEDYAVYRKHNIEMLNHYADLILAVSERTRAIMLQHGINAELIRTSYIGSQFASSQRPQLNKPSSIATIISQNRTFTICYLGYKRIDKGFYFLLDSLRSIDPVIASNIKVVLAVSRLNRHEITETLKAFKQVVLHDGYDRRELTNILQGVDLGIVPVLWEDNLPQVAIEMVACGVPILCSDLGGASELCSSPLFKFVGGDRQDLLDKLTFLVQKPDLLQEYWRHHRSLTTMAQHAAELERCYLET